MNDDQFKQLVIEKLISIENRLSTLEEARRMEIKVVKILTAVLVAVLAKIGIDLTGVLG